MASQFGFELAADDLEVNLSFAQFLVHAGAHGVGEIGSRHLVGAVQALVDEERGHEIDGGLDPQRD